MNYRFQNLLGALYRGGDAVFARDPLCSFPRSATVSLPPTSPPPDSSNITRLSYRPLELMITKSRSGRFPLGSAS